MIPGNDFIIMHYSMINFNAWHSELYTTLFYPCDKAETFDKRNKPTTQKSCFFIHLVASTA